MMGIYQSNILKVRALPLVAIGEIFESYKLTLQKAE